MEERGEWRSVFHEKQTRKRFSPVCRSQASNLQPRLISPLVIGEHYKCHAILRPGVRACVSKAGTSSCRRLAYRLPSIEPLSLTPKNPICHLWRWQDDCSNLNSVSARTEECWWRASGALGTSQKMPQHYSVRMPTRTSRQRLALPQPDGAS